MTRAESIRAAIKAAGKPCMPSEIVRALNVRDSKERTKVYWAVGLMLKDGILDRKRGASGFEYFIVRDPVKAVRMTDEQRRARNREKERARARLRGRRPMAEHLAAVRAAKDARDAAREQERAQRQAEREDERQRFRSSRAAKAKPKPKPRHVMPVVVPARPSMTAAPKPVIHRETVDQFLERGGRIQRLPVGQMTESVLRHRYGRQRKVS